ncbi:TSL-kinase interacting protein 1 [Zea mays]|nr:TSL-kinase interacting protein 1 [Zea mays]ONM40878.1 TSL-kinase interacting protein 1 [Zea mays]
MSYNGSAPEPSDLNRKPANNNRLMDNPILFSQNFDKITHRVQSKNKDQVRHYYYRLVRRMKKLLGPRFSLDAKNSKDTIATMLHCFSCVDLELLQEHVVTALSVESYYSHLTVAIVLC